MSRRGFSRPAVLAFVTLLAGTSLALTQGTAGPLGVADATARRLLVDAILHDVLLTASDEGCHQQ